MKILFNGYPNLLPGANKKIYGGPQNFVHQFAEYVDKNTTHEYVGLVFRRDGRRKKQCGTTVHRFKRHRWIECALDVRHRPITRSKKAVLPPSVSDRINALAEVLKKEKPDVVYLNGFSFVIWYLLRACVMTNTPFVAVHHGLWYQEVRDAGDYFSPAGKRIAEKMEKDISMYAAAEVFLNEWSMRRYQRELTSTDKRKTFVIPLPFRKDFLSKNPAELPKGKTVRIGTVGRWDTIKNPAVFLKLARASRQAQHPWEFYSIVHFTNNKNLKQIEEAYKKNITVLPQTNTAGLKKFYRSMNVLMVLSKFDVSPTVVLEALLQNRMTIISPQVGWVSLYKKFGLDRYIDTGTDVKKTLRRIERVCLDTPPKKLVRYVQHTYAPQAVFKKHVRLLESVINNSTL